MVYEEDASAFRTGTARWAVLALCGVQFVDVLGVTAAITAIPAIIRGLSAPPEATGLLATVYAAFFGGLWFSVLGWAISTGLAACWS